MIALLIVLIGLNADEAGAANAFARPCPWLFEVISGSQMPQELSLKIQRYFREPHADFRRIKFCLDQECTPEELARFYFSSGEYGPGIAPDFAKKMHNALALIWYGVKLMDTSFGEKMRQWPDIVPHELGAIRALLEDLEPVLRARGLLDDAAEITLTQLHEDLDRRLPR